MQNCLIFVQLQFQSDSTYFMLYVSLGLRTVNRAHSCDQLIYMLVLLLFCIVVFDDDDDETAQVVQLLQRLLCRVGQFWPKVEDNILQTI